MNEDATILFPFGGNAGFGKLAIDSMIKYSKKKLGLILTVEPFVSDEEKAWAKDYHDTSHLTASGANYYSIHGRWH